MVFYYYIVCYIKLQGDLPSNLPIESAQVEEINTLISSILGALASDILIYFLTS